MATTTRTKPLSQNFVISYTNPFLPLNFVNGHLLSNVKH